ncbi:MAG: Rpn family recombination-promoting nuclease/putative transposase [Saprospiraceae bacterium]
MKARYINPYTDFGFKKLFGEEANKDLLQDFLNHLLPEEYRIASLTLKNPERQSDHFADRKAIFDIHCESESGIRFVVEMQKAKLKFFKDRAVFYTTFPIREQAEKGDWNFKLNPIFCIALVDFEFDEEKNKPADRYLSHVQLKDQYCEVFYDKLTYVFIEMPRFNKTEEQLATHFEKWLYFLKHLEDFNDIPAVLNEPIFRRGFEVAEIANFDASQRDNYEESLNIYRELKGVVDTSFEEGLMEGLEKGIEKGKLEVAKMLKSMGEPLEKIRQATGLNDAEIEAA